MLKGNTFDLEERLIEFAVRIIKLTEALPDTRTGNHIRGQVLRSGTSKSWGLVLTFNFSSHALPQQLNVKTRPYLQLMFGPCGGCVRLRAWWAFGHFLPVPVQSPLSLGGRAMLTFRDTVR